MWVWQPSVVVKSLCRIQRACCMMLPSLRGDHQIDFSWAGRPSSLSLGDTCTVWTYVTVTGVDTWTVLRDVTVTGGHMDSIEGCNCYWWTRGQYWEMWLSLVDWWTYVPYGQMWLSLVDTWTVWRNVTVTGGHMDCMDRCDCHWWTLLRDVTVTGGHMDSRERCDWLSLVDRDSSNYASALYAFKSFTWSSFEALMREWSLTFKTSRNLLHLSSSILTLTATCGVFYPVHYLFRSRLTTFDS